MAHIKGIEMETDSAFIRDIIAMGIYTVICSASLCMVILLTIFGNDIASLFWGI
jgi:hypothetical protein